MLLKRPNSDKWWYRFKFDGRLYQASTKTSNKRDAERIEAEKKRQLALAQAGIATAVKVPTLKEFAEQEFLPFVEKTIRHAKPRTADFYNYHADKLCSPASRLANLRLDAITPDLIADYASARLASGLEVSSVNRDLATLRRMFNLAVEWSKVRAALCKVRLLKGENQRDVALGLDELNGYIEAAEPLLKDVATILVDCGLRPEECFRLRWEQIRDGAIHIFEGKGNGSRRRIPCTSRVLDVLMSRKAGSEWVFPAPTKTGHIDHSSIRGQHRKAIKAAGLPFFVVYAIRHSAITRWSKAMDTFTLKVLAGHTDIKTTSRYCHPSDERVREAFEQAS